MAHRVSFAAVAVPLLLLLVLSVSGASGARATVGGGGVQEACSKTQFPKICAESLAAKPESQKATCPRKLAELFVNIAADKGKAMATFVQGKYNGLAEKPPATEAEAKPLLGCYDSCSDDVEEAVAHLNGLVREPTDAKFLELKSWLSSTLGGTSTCEDACKDAPKNADKDAVVAFSLDFEKLQRVTLDLITEASGSMSAGIALPPSDAGAPSSYGGAAAPSYGGGASGSAEGPSSSGGSGSGSGSGSSPSEGPAAASGPSAGGGGGAPMYGVGDSGASGPAAADAPAAASGPSDASAPGPASSDAGSSGGAPAPSSGDGVSSSAPTPAGGDDDDADSDDGSA